MADAVDLVRAYLNVNGYFTVSEYPVLEGLGGGGHRMVTDLDLLAFRFGGAGPMKSLSGSKSAVIPILQEPDPLLGRGREQSDMIVAEVKEGRAELNRGARDPHVLEAALVRFGCCNPDMVSGVVGTLIREGVADTGHGHRIRLMAFGATVPQGGSRGYTAIPLGHVISFLRSHLRENWDVVRHAQITDPALKFLSLLEKAGHDTKAEERGELP
jgi:hypothetical protein